MAKKNVTKNIVTALPGVILIMLVAGALTYGGKLAVAEATKPKPAVVKTVTVTKTEEPEATTPDTSGEAEGKTSSSTATSSEPATTPAEPATPTATTNSFVYLRPTASTAGTAIKGLQAGTVVQYTTKTTGQWQKVTVDGQTGYVFVKWLTY